MDMYEIISMRALATNVVELKVYAPYVARRCLAGQFVILRVDADGERVPFTICDYSRSEGSVSLLVQTVGYTTMRLAACKAGDVLSDVAGPLGKPTDLGGYKNILLVAGGIGTAVIYPQAKALNGEGKSADVIVGARSSDLLFYTDELQMYARSVELITDDGSSGRKGIVTDVVRELAAKNTYDCVFAVGPLRMMQAVCKLTRELNIPTIVSMNSLMLDGTGMCGCCRVTVDGNTRYACVDGPEFDGHSVDFEEAIKRNATYKEHEGVCRLRGVL